MFPEINSKKQPSAYDNKFSDFEELKRSTLWKFINNNGNLAKNADGTSIPSNNTVDFNSSKIKYNDFEFVKRITLQDFNSSKFNY